MKALHPWRNETKLSITQNQIVSQFFFNLLEHWNQIVNQLSYPLGQNCLTVNELYDQTAQLLVTKNVMAKTVRTTANTVQ